MPSFTSSWLSTIGCAVQLVIRTANSYWLAICPGFQTSKFKPAVMGVEDGVGLALGVPVCVAVLVDVGVMDRVGVEVLEDPGVGVRSGLAVGEGETVLS